MTAVRTKISPNQYATRLGVDVRKVIHWIEAGELPAINVAADAKARKQYRIDERDIEAFERIRSAANTPTARSQEARARRCRPRPIKQFV